MKCPKCGATYLKVYGSFSGHQKIEFKGEELEVIDSEPTDFEWDDSDMVECLECWHQGSAQEFEAAAEVEEVEANG